MSVIIRPTVPFTSSQRRRLQRWVVRSRAEFTSMQCRLYYHFGAILVETPAECSVTEEALAHIVATQAREAIGASFQYVVDLYQLRRTEKAG